MVSERLLEQLKSLPHQPGVYTMKDAQGAVLYVGKAASLYHRVRSYFGSPMSLTPKIQRMVEKVNDLEFILAKSESEALILENNFIKKHRPPFNTRLRDDKTYPYLKIDLTEAFPRVYITRRVEKDGARYFGPYASAGSLRKTMDLLKKLFPYRSCTKVITGKDPRPCLEYYIHRCVAPCSGYASQGEYREVIDQVILFMEGKQDEVVKSVKQRMEEAAEALQFERAAILRDQVRAIERVSEQQRAVSLKTKDQDVLALARAQDEAWVEVFFIRRGRIVGRDHFMMAGAQDEEPGAILGSFVKQYYDSAVEAPPLLLLQHPLDERESIERWLSERRGGPVHLLVPQRGDQRKLVQMVADNASQGLEQSRFRWMADTEAREGALQELQEQLNLPRPPERIECYDISNIRGTNAVGSMVVFEAGKPKPAHYRRFKIKAVEGIDDYAMMQEMLRRRFKHLSAQGDGAKRTDAGKERSQAWGIVPDLVLIDGGKGHLNAALEVFLQVGVRDVPLASIAKEREEIFLPEMKESVLLPRSSQALYLVQRVRDEAHRFAITYHRKLRSKSTVTSVLDEIAGIGPRRRSALLRRFGSLDSIRQAQPEELAAVPGMTRRLAERLKSLL